MKPGRGRSAPCRLGWALCALPPAAAGAVGDQGGYSPNSENFRSKTLCPLVNTAYASLRAKKPRAAFRAQLS